MPSPRILSKWKITGAIPLILDYKQHDYVTAAISHLPHVIAASLVNLVRDSDSEEGIMKMVAAGGFKDITRIASSSAQMWQQICLTNTDNISTLLNDYIRSLQEFKNSLDSRKEKDLYDLFDSAREYRDSFINASSGPIKRSYVLTVDIADQAGSLAAITTILAVNGINIKNIGITHNREQEYEIKEQLAAVFDELCVIILERKQFIGNEIFDMVQPDYAILNGGALIVDQSKKVLFSNNLEHTVDSNK